MGLIDNKSSLCVWVKWSIYKRISFWFSSIPTCLIWQYQTSVLFESSLKEVHLLLFLEQFAQPGRACLLCFTPEFDKVLVSLAHRCLGASLCQVRVWTSAKSWFPLVFPANPQICWDSWEINFLVSPLPLVSPPPLAKVFPDAILDINQLMIDCTYSSQGHTHTQHLWLWIILQFQRELVGIGD